MQACLAGSGCRALTPLNPPNLSEAPHRRSLISSAPDARRRRHADSDPDQPGRRDHDREINAQGRQDARSAAAHLLAAGWIPDLLLCSNSRRTKQTVEAMASEVGAFDDVDAHFLGTLYTVAALDGMTAAHISERVRDLDSRKRALLASRSPVALKRRCVKLCPTECVRERTIVSKVAWFNRALMIAVGAPRVLCRLSAARS